MKNTYQYPGFYTGFFPGGRGGGNIHVVVAIVSVCKHTLPRGVLGHTLPGKVFNLQPLRRFLVVPETTYSLVC